LRVAAGFLLGRQSGVGSLHRLRDAVENGWPCPLAIEEHSHAAMANAYEAGAAGLPCAIFRGYIGVDLPKVNPRIKHVTCPFTGEVLAAVPAHRPDVGVIHALKADRAGNVLLEGIVGYRRKRCLPPNARSSRSKRSSRILAAQFQRRDPAELDGRRRRGGAGGAYPSYAQGYYKRDNAFYIAWDPFRVIAMVFWLG